MMSRLLSLACAAAMIGCTTVPQRVTPPAAGSAAPRRIVAYVFPRANTTDLTWIGAEKLTHINYAFGRVTPEGELTLLQPDAPAFLAQIQSLKAKNPALRIILSVGGWGADHFSDAALTEESRAKFAASAIAMVRRYALDGVDLDWEYPGQPGPGIKFRPEDKQNFTLLLKTMRQHLDALSTEKKRAASDRYLLTIASSGNRKYFENTEMETLHQYLDFINIMTYDFAGTFSKTTGHHARLYGAAPGASAYAFVRQHLDAGIPPRKLVLGVPFYGKGWIGVNRANDGLNQPFERPGSDYSYANIRRQYLGAPGFTRHWDIDARAPFLWNPESGTFISYEDPQSLEEKANFVKEHDLGGMMYWEHTHDPDEILLDTIYRNLR